MLKIGDVAPEFSLPIQGGELISLASYRGKKVVLYFYPKDMTPGCTTQACDFQDSMERLLAKDVVLIGVSPDSVKRHEKFTEKHTLGFPLVADEENEVATSYGVWKEKKMYGKTFMGIERTTFLIDEDGKIEKIWPKVKVKGHVAEVMDTIEAN